MGNFNNKRSGSEGRGRAGNSKKSTSGKSSYKAGRSFSKNKTFRESKESEPARKSFGGRGDARPYRKRNDEESPRRTSEGSERPVRRERESSGEGYGKDKFSGRKGGSSFDKPRGRSREEDTERSERPARRARESSEDSYSERRSSSSERPRRSRDEGSERSERPARREREGSESYGKDQFSGRRSSGGSWDQPRRRSRDEDSERSERPARRERDSSEDSYSERRSSSSDRPRRSSGEERSDRPSRTPGRSERPSRRDEDSEKPRRSKDDRFGAFREATEENKNRGKRETTSSTGKKPRFSKPRKNDDSETRRVKYDQFEDGKAFSKQRSSFPDKRSKKPAPEKKQTGGDGLIRLNKYLSNAGVASRREADDLILSGSVKVNGVVVDQLGSKISPSDKVTYGDETIRSERKVYLLLNKPKDYITTVDDPQDRKTVMELVKGACKERIYPVGRLDRNTTGLLLLTNDGDLTKKLTHPKHNVKKVYHVSLNKGLKADDFKAIVEGLELEDGMIKADDLAFVGEGKKEIGIEVHSGRNRIVRRIFEHLGYDVLKLDRVVFAGLTKKDLPRGKHRFLTNKEISFLQMIG